MRREKKMVTMLVKNAGRMMSSASVMGDGIERAFMDGCSRLVPFSGILVVAEGGGLKELEFPASYETVLITVDGDQSAVPFAIR